MDLDQLLDHPYGTFHDSIIEHLEIDYLKRVAQFRVRVTTGNPEASEPELRESSKLGLLRISGLLYLVIEPPDESYPYQSPNGLWVSEGELTVDNSQGTPSLPKSLPNNAFAHYFFIQEWNSFIYLAATQAEFQWL